MHNKRNLEDRRHQKLPECELPSLLCQWSQDEGCHGYRGRKIITPPPNSLDTHINTLFSPLFPSVVWAFADVTAKTMNLTYRSEMHIWGAGSHWEVWREKKNGTSALLLDIDKMSKCPWNLKETVIKQERKFKIQSQRDFLLMVPFFFLFPFLRFRCN